MDNRILCLVDGCSKVKYCRGLCSAHYQMLRVHGNPLGGMKRIPPGGKCSVFGCSKLADSVGLCSSHRHKKQRYGDPEGGAKWKKNQCSIFIESLSMGSKECINWPFHVAANGYGSFRSAHGKGAHVASCAKFHGPKPSANLEVAHSCGNRSCVNPEHLRWATKSENMADKEIHGTSKKGEDNPQSKLTSEAVIRMRKMRADLTLRELSSIFGVSKATISKICRREEWKWL